MKRALVVSSVLALTIMMCAEGRGQQQAAPAASAVASPVQKNIETYLRHLYAFGPDVVLEVGALKPTAVEGMMETTIDLTMNNNKQTVKFYVSKDGKFLFSGELSDITKDPLAENRAQIEMKDAPATGDAKAAVTLVD